MHLDTSAVLLISFVIFLLGAGKKLKNFIFGLLDERILRINEDLNKANQTKLHVIEGLNTAKKQQSQTLQEIQLIFANSQIEVNNIKNENLEGLEKILNNKGKFSHQAQERLEQQAGAELYADLRDVTFQAVQKIIKTNLTHEQHTLINEHSLHTLEAELKTL